MNTKIVNLREGSCLFKIGEEEEKVDLSLCAGPLFVIGQYTTQELGLEEADHITDVIAPTLSWDTIHRLLKVKQYLVVYECDTFSLSDVVNSLAMASPSCKFLIKVEVTDRDAPCMHGLHFRVSPCGFVYTFASHPSLFTIFDDQMAMLNTCYSLVTLPMAKVNKGSLVRYCQGGIRDTVNITDHVGPFPIPPPSNDLFAVTCRTIPKHILRRPYKTLHIQAMGRVGLGEKEVCDEMESFEIFGDNLDPHVTSFLEEHNLCRVVKRVRIH